MATINFYLCPSCVEKSWTKSLFDSLLAVAQGRPHDCQKCGTHCELHLEFAYGLGAGGSKNVVLDCFVPDDPQVWRNDDRPGSWVTFYPFLVITETTDDRQRGAWLPYWHIERQGDREAKKYGQWAPSMDLELFVELVRKAQAKGYLQKLRQDPGPVAMIEFG